MMVAAPRSKVQVIVAVVVVVLVVGLGLATCQGRGGDGGGTGTGTASSTTTDAADGRSRLQRDAEGITSALLGQGDESPPVARAEGVVDTLAGPTETQPAVAEILAVEAGDSAILLRWRLKSTGELLRLRPTTFSTGGSPATSATEVVLVSPAVRESAKPYRHKQGSGILCVCSTVPNEVDGTGQDMTGLYPAFSQPPTEVEIRIPGFPPISGVSVTRR